MFRHIVKGGLIFMGGAESHHGGSLVTIDISPRFSMLPFFFYAHDAGVQISRANMGVLSGVYSGGREHFSRAR